MNLRFSFNNLFLVIIFMLTKAMIGLQARQHSNVFDVRQFGAIADGKTDNSQAFLKAWNQACRYKGTSKLVVPQGTFMLRTVNFQGPCRGPVWFNLRGTIKAFNDKSAIFGNYWISFQYINNFNMIGDGTFDGQGAAAWPYNQCGKGQCPQLPITLAFSFLTNSFISGINSIDSRSVHINIYGCDSITLKYINLRAPDDSPNTDGIRIANSHNINILDSAIGTGDDCVALLSGLKNVRVERVRCGPGHGISVGSLGRYPNELDSSGLIVKNCTLVGTQNGLRIKSWESSYRSNVYNFTYEDIVMKNVENPIVINQQYCPSGGCGTGQWSEGHPTVIPSLRCIFVDWLAFRTGGVAIELGSLVAIKDVSFTNIRGTSASPIAVNLQCSHIVPCQSIILKDINIKHIGGGKFPLKSSCFFANGFSSGVQIPKACI